MKNLKDKEFFQKLRYIRPSKSYNEELIKEIKRRDISNNLYVLKYLKDLEELKICEYEVQALLLSHFDLSDQTSRFLVSENKFVEVERGRYDFERLVRSIKEYKMTEDLKRFLDTIESILMSTRNKQVEKEGTLLRRININHQAISDFLNLVKEFKRKKRVRKGEVAVLQDLKKGFLSYREVWFFVFRSRVLSEYVLFVFYFLCMDKVNVLKYQILRNMIEEEIGGQSLEIFKESRERLADYLSEDLFSNFHEEFVEKSSKEPTTNEEPSRETNKEPSRASKETLSWYKERERAFTATDN